MFVEQNRVKEDIVVSIDFPLETVSYCTSVHVQTILPDVEKCESLCLFFDHKTVSLLQSEPISHTESSP